MGLGGNVAPVLHTLQRHPRLPGRDERGRAGGGPRSLVQEPGRRRHAVARGKGVPIAGLTYYGAIDHVDWDSALRVRNLNINPCGMWALSWQGDKLVRNAHRPGRPLQTLHLQPAGGERWCAGPRRSRREGAESAGPSDSRQ